MANRTLSETLMNIREMGLENTFQRFYSFYQAVVKEREDERQIGRVRIHADSIGFPEPHPGFADMFTPYGGDDFGFFFPPYTDSKVYVSFDQGDPSSPMVMGGLWHTRGEKKITDTGLPAEFVKTKKDSEGNDIGDSPVVRGIKVKTGSALIFDETEDEVAVELWSGTTQGIGKLAEKNHRIRFDNTKDAGQLVVATFGDANSNVKTINDDDSNAVKAKKELEGRLRHQILMRDTTDDRFVQIKSIGEDDDKKFLKFLMSDTEKKIRIESSNEHFFEIDDENDTSTWSVKDGFLWLIDQKNKLMKGTTKDGRKITLDDNDSSIKIETPDNQIFKFDKSETLLQDDSHDINIVTGAAHNITAKTASTHTYDADLTFEIQDWTQKIKAALSIIVTNKITIKAQEVEITAPTVTISSQAVEIGSGNIQTLVNSTFFDIFNSHTHSFVGTGSVLTPSGASVVPAVHATIFTKAG